LPGLLGIDWKPLTAGGKGYAWNGAETKQSLGSEDRINKRNTRVLCLQVRS
jgi:hypothetical protein